MAEVFPFHRFPELRFLILFPFCFSLRSSLLLILRFLVIFGDSLLRRFLNPRIRTARVLLWRMDMIACSMPSRMSLTAVFWPTTSFTTRSGLSNFDHSFCAIPTLRDGRSIAPQTPAGIGRCASREKTIL